MSAWHVLPQHGKSGGYGKGTAGNAAGFLDSESRQGPELVSLRSAVESAVWPGTPPGLLVGGWALP